MVRNSEVTILIKMHPPKSHIENESKSLTALLIEDNSDDAEFLSRHLRRVKQYAIRFEHCESLSSGLQRLAKGGIDIIFLDLSLPDSYGIETVARVRKECLAAIPVVVLTGSDDDELALSVLKTGAQDYLVKGQLDPSTLGRSIKYAIERQRSTVALHWLEAVVDGSNDAIIGLSDRNSIVSWNRGAERIFDYNFDEVINRPLEDFVPLEVVDVKALIEQFRHNEEPEPYEVSYLSKYGREMTVFISTSPVCNAEGLNTGVSLIIRDLTQQRLTERALRESDQRLERQVQEAKKRREQILEDIVENAPVGIVIFDSTLKIITTANTAFSSMVQNEQSSVIGSAVNAILPQEAQSSVEKVLVSGEQLQVKRLKVTVANKPATGPRFWDLFLWPVSNDEGHMLEVVMQVSDCTATVLLEQQRDDFVASVAHDIKNPLLGAERMFSILCEQARGNVAPDSTAAMLSLLRDGNQNLLSLVQNLVDVYRYETVAYPCHFEEIDLATSVLSCINQMSHFAESRNVAIKFENQIGSNSNYIQADAIGIRRVIMNLLHNAVKFNKIGGTTEIILERTADIMRVRVRDTGVGMRPDEQKHLFQRFSQATNGKAISGGTGLGLYLSKQILNAHNGDISCSSTIGLGTEFVFTIPVFQVEQGNSNVAIPDGVCPNI